MKDYNKKLVFSNKDCKYLMTDMINNILNVSLSNYLRDAIDNLYSHTCSYVTICYRHFFIIVFILKLILMTIEILFILHVANGIHIITQVYLHEFIYKKCYNYLYTCMNTFFLKIIL